MTTLEDRLAALVERVSGIVLGEQDVPRLGRLARERARANGFSDPSSYVDALRKAPDGAEWREILGLITVNESFLFRGSSQFAALTDSIIRKQVAAGRSAIRIWSAGCARGEEPATIAVVLAACETLGTCNWKVLATDVDEGALEIARKGVFSQQAVRRVPPRFLERYFEPRGDRYQLVASLRNRIDYRYLNLVRSPLPLPEGPFDAVFMRNVLIYFREDSQARVVASIAPHLAPGGCLFVGPSESLRHLAPQYVVHDFGDCFAYETAAGAEVPPPPGKPVRSSEGPGRGIQSRVGERGSGAAELKDAVAAFERGDDADAEALLRASPHQADDPLVYILTGLLAERAGRLDEAVRAFRAASYLDRSLYQARFLMARCLAATGWIDRARTELRALGAMLEGGGGKAVLWADQLRLPTRSEIRRVCRDLDHQSTSTCRLFPP